MLLSAGPFWWNTWSFYVLLLEIHCHLTPKLPPQYYHLCTSPSWSWSDYLLWITRHWPCEAHLWAGGRRRVLAAALGWCYLCLMSGHLSNRFRTVNVGNSSFYTKWNSVWTASWNNSIRKCCAGTRLDRCILCWNQSFGWANKVFPDAGSFLP